MQKKILFLHFLKKSSSYKASSFIEFRKMPVFDGGIARINPTDQEEVVAKYICIFRWMYIDMLGEEEAAAAWCFSGVPWRFYAI